MLFINHPVVIEGCSLFLLYSTQSPFSGTRNQWRLLLFLEQLSEQIANTVSIFHIWFECKEKKITCNSNTLPICYLRFGAVHHRHSEVDGCATRWMILLVFLCFFWNDPRNTLHITFRCDNCPSMEHLQLRHLWRHEQEIFHNFFICKCKYYKQCGSTVRDKINHNGGAHAGGY